MIDSFCPTKKCLRWVTLVVDFGVTLVEGILLITPIVLSIKWTVGKVGCRTSGTLFLSSRFFDTVKTAIVCLGHRSNLLLVKACAALLCFRKRLKKFEKTTWCRTTVQPRSSIRIHENAPRDFFARLK